MASTQNLSKSKNNIIEKSCNKNKDDSYLGIYQIDEFDRSIGVSGDRNILAKTMVKSSFMSTKNA